MARRRAKRPNAFRLLKQRYELLMGAINEGVYDWNVVDDTIYYSDSVKQAVGLPPELLKTAADWRDRIHPEDLPRYEAAFIDLFKGRTKRFECDYRFRALDGSWRWARQHGVAVRGANGRVRRVVGATGDITELKDTEQALKQSEQRYALATRAATEGIYEWNVESGALFISDRAREVFGLGSGALKNTDWTARMHPDDFAHYRAAIIGHFKGRSPGVECEYRVRDAAGSYRWVLDRGQAVRRADGRAIRLIGAEADITQRKEALAEQTATAEILKVTTSSPTDVQPVFEAVLANALRLCEASFAAVFTFDGELLRNVAHLNASPEFARFLGSGGVRPSRETTTRRCALERRTIHTADLMNDPEFSPPEAQRREKVRTSLSVPMFREKALVGVISLWRAEVRPFTDKQIALVETFAAQAAIAIENVRLFNQTREALDQQTATAEILQITARSPSDVQPVFDAIARSAMRLCDGSHCALFRFDGRLQHFAAHYGVDPQTVDLLRRIYPRPPDPTRISGRAILEREVIHLADALSDTRFPGSAESLTSAGNRAVLAVPMLKAGEPIGVIFMVRREPRRFSDRQVALLKTFADQAVIAIENVRLFNETREALEQQTATADILR
ncbi:MAG: PAS domain-containing protein, partial [Burkholderiales bacterium]